MVWCPPSLRDGGILILKSSNHWGKRFFHHMGGKSIWGTVIMVTKREGTNQVKTSIILQNFLFQGKETFKVTFKEKIVFIFTLLNLKGNMYTVVFLILKK